MHINVPQPFSHQAMVFNELHQFVMFCMSCHRECLEEREYLRPVLEIPASEFPDDE